MNEKQMKVQRIYQEKIKEKNAEKGDHSVDQSREWFGLYLVFLLALVLIHLFDTVSI